MIYIYLIAAHKSPQQLKRLIERLNTENSKFYIHIDLKSNLSDFKEFIKEENVIFIKKRIDCIWGDFSQVEATLNLVEIALQNNSNGYFIFLSGQCYPIKSIKYIQQFIEKNRSINFIDINKVNDIWGKDECYRRFNLYKFNLSNKRQDYLFIGPTKIKTISKLLIKKKINLKTLVKILSKKKKIPFELYGGSSWWAMNFDTLSKVQKYIRINSDKVVPFFKYTSCADEVFFQSIIKELIKTGHEINYKNSITYVNWERKGCELPVTFDHNDFFELVNDSDNKLFARKFDIDYNEEILNLLDEHSTNYSRSFS